MQFQVPQFLDVEDKIFGPFTIKQFLYLAGGIGLAYLSYKFVPWIGIPLGLGFVALGAALAFYKFNNKPFVFLIESAFNYIRSDRFYVWRSKERPTEKTVDLQNFRPTKHGTGLSFKTVTNKLSDLAWSMDIKKEDAAEQKRSDELGI